MILVLALVLASSPSIVLAEGLLIPGAVIYIDGGSCPTDFTVLDATANTGGQGRIFLGDTNTGSGSVNGETSLTDQEDRAHYHQDGDATSYLSATTTPSAPTTIFANPTFDWDILKTGAYHSHGTGKTNTAKSGYAFVQLLGCKLSPTAPSGPYKVPPNAAILHELPTVPTVCPGTMSAFTQAQGYAFVGAPSPSPGAFTQYGTALTTGAADFTKHTHTISPGATASFTLHLRAPPTSGPNYALPNPSAAVTGNVALASNTLPHKRALVCLAGATAQPTGVDLPDGSLVFFSATSCPSAYLGTVSPTLYGRLIVNKLTASGVPSAKSLAAKLLKVALNHENAP
jgi:hypothetical protein